MLLIYALVVSCFSLAFGSTDFKLQHCDGVDGADKQLQLLDVKPKHYPFVLPGAIEGAIKFQVNKAPVNGTRYDLVLHLERYLFVGYITLPCLKGLGSCTYDFCDLLARRGKQLAQDDKCEKLPCSCEGLKPGLYEVPDFKLEVPKEKFTGALTSLLYGDYKADVKIVKHETKEVMACLHLEFTLDAPADDTDDSDECEGIFCD